MKLLLLILIPVILIVVLAITIPDFMKVRNIMNIIEQLSTLGFMAIGMTFVMAAGGIDLSMVTVVSASAVVGATFMFHSGSPVIGCLLMISIGIGFGLINGVAIAVARMNAFIVTLSTMVLADGFAVWFTRTRSIYGLPESYIDTIAGKLFGIIPVPAIIVIITAVITGVILAKSIYGRMIYLTGVNEETSRVSGIPTVFTKFSTYVFSGLMAGITAIVLTAMINTATTSMVKDVRLMDIISATVIGGASLQGGTGSVFGTMLGVLLLTVLGNCFNLIGVSDYVGMIIKGVIIVLIIGIDVLRSRH